VISLLLAAAVPWQPTGTGAANLEVEPLSEQQLEVEPLSEQEIAAEWGETCFASKLEIDGLERALDDTKFKEDALTMNGLRRNWTSPNGSLAFIKFVQTIPQIPLPQCNLTLFTREAVDARAFTQAMNAELENRLGIPVGYRAGPFGETWWWRDAGKPFKVSRIYIDGVSQQIELTLSPGEPEPEPAAAETTERG
jgi:hypothetical protein